ncbi:MAG: exo-alpha-sialidase [Chitinophagaceae bacterium]|nr:MAG: exo-alpha-sialidase [Chitinophagaceae bacterium]
MNLSYLACGMLLLSPFVFPIKETNLPVVKKAAVAVALVFKSTDAGQSWQNISEGLPQTWQADNIPAEGFFADDNGLFVRAGTGVYQNKQASGTWNKEIFPAKQVSITPGRSGIFAYNSSGDFLHKITGTLTWSPVYTNFKYSGVRSIFETEKGTVLIGSDYGLFKSGDRGKTWKALSAGAMIMKIVESNGILLATGRDGILRSSDDGESWDRVLHKGGVGIQVERIEGGFAAIVYDTKLNARIIRASYDGGKTWQPVDIGLKPDPLIASIVELGGSFYCGHPDGVYKSSDKGKTWKLIFASVDNLVFNLFVSGNVLYAIPRNGGC